MYQCKLDAFELSLKTDPTSLDTERNLNSLVAVLNDMTVVLGDASNIDACSSATHQEQNESKEDAVARKELEEKTRVVLQCMQQSSKERKTMEAQFESSLIRWKVGYTTKSIVVVVKEEEEEKQEDNVA